MRWSETPEQVPWGRVREGAWLRPFLDALWREGVRGLVANAQGRVHLAQVDDRVLPVVVPGPSLTWTASIRTAYVDYAAEELRLVPGAAVRAGLRGALLGLGAMLQAASVDRVVLVDDLLLSTCLHPPLGEAAVRAVTEAVAARWPDRAVVWRSLHTFGGSGLDGVLARCGYRAVPSRSVWLWDPTRPDHRDARDLRRDARLLGTRGYAVVGPEGLGPGDAPRIRALYDALYLDKYSRLNPHFTEAFATMALAGGLEVRALRREGRLDAVVGFYVRDGQMTTPLFGYDTGRPQRLGLYRMASAVLVQEATARGVLLHQSAGAASFKRNRHAEGALEVMRVWDRHLGPRRRAGWAALEAAMRRVAVPLVGRMGV